MAVMSSYRFPLLIGGALGSVALGVLVHSWAPIVFGIAAITALAISRMWVPRSGNHLSLILPAVAATGLLGTGGLALGIYAMIAAESRFTGIVILLALLFPSAYFVVLTWAGMHFVVTGKRIRQADLIEAFLARLNRPLRGRRRRSP